MGNNLHVNVSTLHDTLVVHVRKHVCLYVHGEFNCLSLSQSRKPCN